jgi:hypothetical protein
VVVVPLVKNTVPPLAAPTGLVVGKWGNSLTVAPPLRWVGVSGATDYQVALGGAGGTANIVPWTNVGDVRSVVLTGLALTEGEDYYTSIRALDGMGRMSSVATSTGWQVAISGVFQPRVQYANIANNQTRAVGLVDLNDDGRLDLVSTGVKPAGANNQFSYFIGNGNGTFGPRTDRDQACTVGQAVLPADFNRDGFDDVVVICFGDFAVMFPGTGTGSFGTRVDYPTTTRETSGVVGDINGDTYPDVVTSAYLDHSVAIMLNRGVANPGVFQPRTFIPLTTDIVGNPAEPKDIVLGDVNDDGRADIVVSIESGIGTFANSVMVLLGTGPGTFGPAIVSTVPLGNMLKDLVLVDLNRDGNLDVVVASSDSNRVMALLGNGLGNFALAASLDMLNRPYGVASIDLNEDDLPDLLVANSLGNTLSLFLGRGDGTFSPPSSYVTGLTPYRIELGDFRPDAVVSERNGNSVGVFIFNQ